MCANGNNHVVRGYGYRNRRHLSFGGFEIIEVRCGGHQVVLKSVSRETAAIQEARGHCVQTGTEFQGFVPHWSLLERS
jgi:hypothetical protein